MKLYIKKNELSIEHILSFTFTVLYKNMENILLLMIIATINALLTILTTNKIALIFLELVPIYIGLTMAVMTYKYINKEKISLWPCFMQVFKKTIPIFIIFTILSIAVAIGFTILFMPGVMIFTYTSFSVLYCLLEDKSSIESIKRSYFKLKDHLWKTIAVFCVIFFMSLLLIAPFIYLNILVTSQILKLIFIFFGSIFPILFFCCSLTIYFVNVNSIKNKKFVEVLR